MLDSFLLIFLCLEMTEEEKAQEREEEKIDQLNPQDPRFYLNTYYVEIAKGTQIDRLRSSSSAARMPRA